MSAAEFERELAAYDRWRMLEEHPESLRLPSDLVRALDHELGMIEEYLEPLRYWLYYSQDDRPVSELWARVKGFMPGVYAHARRARRLVRGRRL